MANHAGRTERKGKGLLVVYEEWEDRTRHRPLNLGCHILPLKVALTGLFLGHVWTDLAELWWTHGQNQVSYVQQCLDQISPQKGREKVCPTQFLKAKYRNRTLKDEVCKGQ